METETRERGENLFPRVGVAISVLLSLLMFGVGAAVWADLPAMIPGGKVDFAGEPTMTPRWLFAVAMPSVTLCVAPVVAFLPALGERFQRLSGQGAPWSSPSLRRFLNLLLPLLSLVLAILHTVLLLREAGRATWPSTDHLMLAVLALFLVGVGLIVPLLRPGAGSDDPVARWWERARVPVGVGIVLVGSVTAATGFLLGEPVMAAYATGLIGPVILVGCAVPFIGERNRKNDSRSGT